MEYEVGKEGGKSMLWLLSEVRLTKVRQHAQFVTTGPMVKTTEGTRNSCWQLSA